MGRVSGCALRTSQSELNAKHKPLYVAKEHVLVYLSVLGGMVKKRYQATKGS